MYCAINGILIKEKGLPEVSAVKVVPLGENNDDKNMLYEYWPVEVEDYQLFMVGATLPQLKVYPSQLIVYYFEIIFKFLIIK